MKRLLPMFVFTATLGLGIAPVPLLAQGGNGGPAPAVTAGYAGPPHGLPYYPGTDPRPPRVFVPANRGNQPAGAPAERSTDPLEALLNHPLDPSTPIPRVTLENFPREHAVTKDARVRQDLFVRTLLPLLLAENERILQVRERMLPLLERVEAGRALAPAAEEWLRELATEYKVSGDPLAEAKTRTLLRKRVDVIPVSLAIAQAANESGWGKSQAARKGNNVFGITGGKGKTVVGDQRGFQDLGHAVSFYVATLNTHRAYQPLRDIRSRLRSQDKPVTGRALADGLTRYSELGSEYVKRIKGMIAQNRLEDLNTIRLADGNV